jgi:uncharacterized membrane protein YphA (DoxX/SURF4 family)
MTTGQETSKALHITLWIVQVLLAGLFLMAGFMKTTQPIEQLSAMLPWTGQVPAGLVRFIGVSELSGALGLLLPSILRIKPHLTLWAAIGIATIMLLGLLFHVWRGEYSTIGFNLFIGLLAAFIAWGRFRKVPIESKS